MNQWRESGDLFQPIPGGRWSDDFKTPTQVAVTCSSPAHIEDHNFHDCTSHDSLGKQDKRRQTNREAEGKQRTRTD